MNCIYLMNFSENFGQSEESRSKLKWLNSVAKRAIKRTRKKLDKQNEELAFAQRADAFTQIADSLLADASLTISRDKPTPVKNIHTSRNELIELNPAKSVHENAGLFYKKARKARRGVEKIQSNIEVTSTELNLLESIRDTIGELRNIEEDEQDTGAVARVEEQLRERGVIPSVSKAATPRRAALPFRHYTSESWDIYIGKTSKQNDELSLKFAQPSDIWLHVAAHAGSHVIIRRNRNQDKPPKSVQKKAAILAAWFSKARHSSYIDVHVTEARYVRKRRKAPPGEVIAERCRTLRVSPRAPSGLFTNPE
ncbi:MAG: DUF814 domain-containing protein [Chitinivibrionales bacterium]|nr:DUF814 domain-containing protein [Chitinivibrionales bacterium]